MKNRSGEKIKLASIDELLGVVNEESAMEIEISKIHPFKNHPFKVLDDEKMQDLVESVRINGVLTPVLLRMDDNEEYEMVSGHRRMHAAQLAGLTTIPAIVRELSDDDAVIAMVDANIQREELLPSEKAFAYKMKLDAMKRQGSRTDLTLCQSGTKSRTDQLLGEQVGESARSVQRYIRLTELIPELLDLVDNKKLQFTVAVDISYIDKEVQETGIGLIEKRRQGFGKVNVIYVKTFMPEKTDEKKFEEELKKFKKQTSVENEEPAEVYNSNFMKSQNQTSRSPENKLQEVYISNPNNTNLSDTEMNDNKSNHIISVDEKRFDSDNRSEDYQAYENLVKETIDYESLEVTHHDDMRQVDEIVNLIVETVMCKNDKILIASNWYPASLVKKKFLMLTYSHIEYVLHCMSGNTTKVKNIKKYLLAALFNAPSTMNGYYQAEVNHDMPGLVR